MIRQLGIVIAVALLFVSVSAPLSGQTAADFIRQGDEFYAKFNHAQGLEEYLKAAKAKPENYRGALENGEAVL